MLKMFWDLEFENVEIVLRSNVLREKIQGSCPLFKGGQRGCG